MKETIAILHDWLVVPGGAEKVLESITKLYKGDLFVLIKRGKWESICRRKVMVSKLNILPKISSYYPYLLPLFPFALKSLDLGRYRLILSSSHAVIKNIKKQPGQIHICYCHTPMRYAWDLMDGYLEKFPHLWMRRYVKRFLHWMQNWDRSFQDEVDVYIANSHFVADRIKNAYGKDSYVVYPPVDVERYPLEIKKHRYFITVGRLVAYKRVDLIIEAFKEFPNEQLIVIGEGPELKSLKRKAGTNISFLGAVSEKEKVFWMKKARAFLFAAVEDFGITVVESIALGTPVIALNRGGARETVIEGVSGVFFDNQTADSLSKGIEEFLRGKYSFDPLKMRSSVEKFSRSRFEKEYKEFVEKVLKEDV